MRARPRVRPSHPPIELPSSTRRGDTGENACYASGQIKIGAEGRLRARTPREGARSSPRRGRGRSRCRKFTSSVAGHFLHAVGAATTHSTLYDTIVSSRNCRRSHLSPFPLPREHTPAHFPPVNSSALSNSPPTLDISLLPPRGGGGGGSGGDDDGGRSLYPRARARYYAAAYRRD